MAYVLVQDSDRNWDHLQASSSSVSLGGWQVLILQWVLLMGVHMAAKASDRRQGQNKAHSSSGDLGHKYTITQL